VKPSSKQIICFDFRKQNSVLPIVFYVPWLQENTFPDTFAEKKVPSSLPTCGQFHQHFTRSFFWYERFVHSFLHFRFVLYWQKYIGTKAAHEMLLKSTPAFFA
jgi:hypothetical protein